jgi:dTDP-4-dehydrorhamnose reductase
LETKWFTLRVLITGASGLYGSKLSQIISKDCEVYSGYRKDQRVCGIPLQFNVSNKNQVERAFKKANPDVVVHAATLTNVDECETNQKLAWKTNVEGTRNTAEAAKACGAFLFYVSTDYVFNGEKGNYTETDTPDPINYYGLTKLKAEELVKELLDEYCIARPSVIYGATPAAGKINFALWLIDNLKQRKSVKIVVDQFNSPTLNTNLAEMTWEIIQRKMTGIYHLSGATRINRYNFAKSIASAFNLDSTLIIPSASSEFDWAAKRPKDTSLNVDKAQNTLTNRPLPVDQALSQLRSEMQRFEFPKGDYPQKHQTQHKAN